MPTRLPGSKRLRMDDRIFSIRDPRMNCRIGINEGNIFMTPATTNEEYAEQIRRCAQALALAKNDLVQSELASGHTLERLKMFTDGNLEKRFEKLVGECEFLAEEFEDLEEVIICYVKSIPLTAYDTGCTDAERFLRHLEATRSLTPEQTDFITCQQGRYALEFQALEHRMEHVRFQEMSGMVETFSEEWGTNPDLWIYLNPLRVWATFYTTVLLEEDDEVPAKVLFYPVGADTRTAVLEDDGLAVVHFLETRNRVKLDDRAWKETNLSREERIAICRDLADIGLAAFG